MLGSKEIAKFELNNEDKTSIGITEDFRKVQTDFQVNLQNKSF